MGVSSVNNGSGVVWNSDTTRIKGEKVDFSNSAKPANMDKFVLNLPKSETVYKRQELVTDARMGEGCAFCRTYTERTMTFADDKYGSLTFTGSSGGYFVINADKTKQTFGKSGADMNDIGYAAEETLEHKDREWEHITVSGGITGDDHMTDGSVGFAGQSVKYKYSSVSQTKGMLAFKNGGVGIYRETALSNREIYFKCSVFNAKV